MQKGFTIVLFFSLAVLFSNSLNAQEIIKTFHQNTFGKEKLASLKAKFGKHKTLLADYENQMLIALSYFPELENIKIKFRLKNRETPLATRPAFFSMFRSPKKRTYIITISKKSTLILDTITFKNLRFNAQIGVLGHELSHISDYTKKGFAKIFHIGFIQLFSKNKLDRFEFNTDLDCINHGLGYQLLDWSCNVRESLERKNWLGAVNLSTDQESERYMNPATILEIISKHPLYQENQKMISNCQDLQ
ncbi:Protein of unknown function precursor [Flavobacterium indicum GPTSA100-9 = DSM 17447]|uniref:Secreted protein n=1 Tax=Flavobacterium indicum (strain DSM 17447 / CIP 109464 / GPTSA100-9) TaxID=1094466 RepID=H8XT54_FLAIG|nr:hypothetical protein [Flavobacterium indicum]CCG53596.1 Protein of unknown function precursor [Flavobacterium indicum GPTSA100-9 = DSM 17447]